MGDEGLEERVGRAGTPHSSASDSAEDEQSNPVLFHGIAIRDVVDGWIQANEPAGSRALGDERVLLSEGSHRIGKSEGCRQIGVRITVDHQNAVGTCCGFTG